ncbi:MAG: DUF1127 domain-containing protein [Acetobacteraceae bacterium]
MASLAHSTLTNSQLSPLAAQPWDGRLERFVATLRAWRRRHAERQVLAGLTRRELADFGASSVDVYRELNSPFWRAQPPC